MDVKELFRAHGYRVLVSDEGEKTSSRYIHAKIQDIKSNTTYFAKVARNKTLEKNLQRESALTKRAKNVPRGIKLLSAIKRPWASCFMYEYLPDKRMSDHVDRAKGQIQRSSVSKMCQLAVEFSYFQRTIQYKPTEMFLNIKQLETELVDKAQRSPIYRRSELLSCYRKLNQGRKTYCYEIGDFQLQNLVFTTKPLKLVLFDLEAWSLFRANWSIASLFTISWFRHYGEKISTQLYRAFLKHPKTSKHEIENFLLCSLYFIFMYYPSYSKRAVRFKRHFDDLIDWILREIARVEES